MKSEESNSDELQATSDEMVQGIKFKVEMLLRNVDICVAKYSCNSWDSWSELNHELYLFLFEHELHEFHECLSCGGESYEWQVIFWIKNLKVNEKGPYQLIQPLFV